MRELTRSAYAKINLYLKVTGRRDDGYHDLVTVMQSVSLADTLTFRKMEGEGISVDSGGVLPDDDKNLVARAARAYFAASGKPFGLLVQLTKRIPMAAGMGGGSADAAATLLALNEMEGGCMTRDELLKIAATIGADVPFCLTGGTALCRGIGERIEPIESRLDGVFVVAIAGEGVSTPAAFAALDGLYGKSFPAGDLPDDLIEGLSRGETDATAHFYNMFERVVEPLRPHVGACKDILRQYGARRAMMSGSGPSVFGFFEKENDAACAHDALLKSGARAFLCRAMPAMQEYTTAL